MQEGRQVQRLAETLQTIILVLGILEAIVVFITTGRSGSYLVGFLIAMIIVAGSAFAAWVLKILLDAFGVLVCYVARIEDMLAKIPAVDTASSSQRHTAEIARATIAERNADHPNRSVKK